MVELRPITYVLKGALGSAGLAVLGLIILSIFALPFGGPLILLYYGAYVVLYVVPFAMLFGAVVGLISLVTKESSSEQPPIRWTYVSILGVCLVFIAIIAYVVFPHFTVDQNSYVHHGATWFYVETDDPNLALTVQERSRCNTQMVFLRLEAYTDLHVVCDQAVVDYLETVDNEIVRVTYRVTSDFGDPRSWQLVSVGDVPITWATWTGSWRGCGGPYRHSCNSPQAQSGSALLESSWPDA